MAGVSNILQTLAFGFVAWKKVGEPIYNMFKENHDIQDNIKSNEKRLRDYEIDLSLIYDEEYIKSLSPKQKEIVNWYYQQDESLQRKMCEHQEKQQYFYQTQDMESVKWQLKSCGINPEQVKDRNYFRSLTPTQKNMANVYLRMQMYYLNVERQKEFYEACERLNQLYEEIMEESY